MGYQGDRTNYEFGGDNGSGLYSVNTTGAGSIDDKCQFCNMHHLSDDTCDAYNPLAVGGVDEYEELGGDM
jgi:hypothetical protein